MRSGEGHETGRRLLLRQLVTRPPGLPAVVLKIGTLDEPSLFGSPQMPIYTVDKQAYHQIPDGIPTFKGLPPR